MKKDMRDKSIVKEAIGDPAFYNDQIDENLNPAKVITDKKTDRKDLKIETKK